MSLGQVFPEAYPQLLAAKEERLKNLLSLDVSSALSIYPSDTENFRQRAEFRIWHNGDDIYHTMFNPGERKPVRVDTFPIACKPIANFMPILLEKIKFNHQLRYRLYQVDYLAATTGELLVSLIYKRKLDDEWLKAAALLQEELADSLQVKFIGRSRKQKIVVTTDFVTETFQVGSKPIHYQQIEGSFTQPNAGVNQYMLNWASEVASQLTGDLLELYCGNGNFSLALADYFPTVVATELSRTSIKSAQYNIALNQIQNVKVLQMAAEDVSAALTSGTYLKELDLSKLQLNTVLVDPPRAGLDEATLTFVSTFKNIIYISCNPETLAMNLEMLKKTHQLKRVALFDQFPYTEHIETGVWLSQN